MKKPIPEVEPTLCYKCDDWFDKKDGYPSLKWYDHSHICPECHVLENKEIVEDHEIKAIESLVGANELSNKEGRSMIINLRKNYYTKLEAEL